VNYSGYPVENVTLKFPGGLKSARMLSPEAPAKELELYPSKEETTVEIDKVGTCATLILEQESGT